MNNKIEKLIKSFAKLPRVGNRAAVRIVLSLLQDKTGRAESLAEMLINTAQNIHPCKICGCLTDGELCEYCRDVSRENNQLCLVRDMGDVWTLEKSGIFPGRYQVIGGLLSGAAGITPEDLFIASLPARIRDEKIAEIIFALPNTVEGKTTQHYIMNVLENDAGITDISFSELASGVPLGGDLDYIDDGTLSIAFGTRKKI